MVNILVCDYRKLFPRRDDNCHIVRHNDIVCRMENKDLYDILQCQRWYWRTSIADENIWANANPVGHNANEGKRICWQLYRDV